MPESQAQDGERTSERDTFNDQNKHWHLETESFISLNGSGLAIGSWCMRKSGLSDHFVGDGAEADRTVLRGGLSLLRVRKG